MSGRAHKIYAPATIDAANVHHVLICSRQSVSPRARLDRGFLRRLRAPGHAFGTRRLLFCLALWSDRQEKTNSFLKKVTIANPGIAEGLRAKFGRLFSSPNSAPSSSDGKQIPKKFASTAPLSLQRQGSEEGQQEAMLVDSVESETGEMTTLFLSHGSPMLPIQMDDPARQFIVELPTQIKKPKAIVMISAHWDTTEPTVNAMATNDTIHDFYGFPKDLYKLRYDAPGDPVLAQRVVDLLKEGGFPKAKKNEKRGLDHGAWIPLLLMYPEKNIPVIQLSVQYRKDGAHHYKVGQALAPLKNEGVLVIGSGSATHNLGTISFEEGPTATWAVAFDNWLNDAFVNKRHDEVMNFTEKAPYARKAHPTPDHFLPAIVALGAAGEDAISERLHSSWCLRSISMASFSFKSPPAAAAVSA